MLVPNNYVENFIFCGLTDFMDDGYYMQVTA